MGCSSRFMSQASRLWPPGATGGDPVPPPVRRAVGLPGGGDARKLIGVDVLIEREADLGVLEGALAGAIAGRGSAVLVDGEAGIGKTRLLDVARAGAIA